MKKSASISGSKTPKKIYSTRKSSVKSRGKEKWKSFKKYNCKVSTHGRVRSIISGRILKQSVSGGYYQVNLWKNKKTINSRVHRLIALAFIKRIKGCNVVDHIDNNKLNNMIDNLRWVTQKINMESYHNNHKPKRIILQYNINGHLIRKWNSINHIIKKNPTYNSKTLNQNIRGGSKSAYGYVWQCHTPIKPKINLDKDNEYFKKIKPFENNDLSDYKISNYGRIKNFRGVILRANSNSDGYYRICLDNKITNKRQQYYINRLVAHTFIPNINGINLEVNHKDKNRGNNFYKNLEWVTHSENMIHAYNNQIQMIDLETDKVLKIFTCQRDANVYLGKPRHYNNISKVLCGRQATAYGYKWKYDNDICHVTEMDLEEIDHYDVFD